MRQPELPIHTGRGTPGGDLLRRYWQPVVLSRALKRNAPQPVRVLGEELVLYRGEDGAPALVGLRCPHRRADLSYGRIDGNGLRCLYHGWLFDAKGRCVEQPGEPEGGRHRDRVRMPAYPCVERAGAVWAYLGEGEPPLFPNYPVLSAPDDLGFVFRWHARCNYLQGNEGNVDPVHTSYLHAFRAAPDAASDELRTGRTQQIFGADTAPTIAVRDTRIGLRLLTERKLPAGKRLLRVTNFVMPNACAIGGAETPFGRGGASMFWHVPIDDTSHWRYEFTFHSKVRLPREQMEARYLEEADAEGMPRRQAENRYLQNRDEMDRYYAGMGITFPVHDLFITESQGEILDRSEEHLVSSDVAIARSRRLLLEALGQIAAGQDPRGVVRDPAENDFRDLLVLSEEIGTDEDADAFCTKLEAQNIYEIKPELRP
jgi:phthalate 4,5-dioxygenase oxygenase subunit